MSIGSQVTAFCRDVFKNRLFWTIQFEAGNFIIWRNEDDLEVFPFWSSESRVDRIIKSNQDWTSAKAVSISLDEFEKEWLPRFLDKKIKIGPNWVGENLTGWSFEPLKLLQRIENQALNDS